MGRGRKDSAVLPVVVIEIILVSFFGILTKIIPTTMLCRQFVFFQWQQPRRRKEMVYARVPVTRMLSRVLH